MGRELRTTISTFTQLLSTVTKVQCCFTSTETIRIIMDGELRTVTSTFTQLLSSVTKVQCCFTATETIKTIKDRELSMAIWTFTQLLSSEGDQDPGKWRNKESFHSFSSPFYFIYIFVSIAQTVLKCLEIVSHPQLALLHHTV